MTARRKNARRIKRRGVQLQISTTATRQVAERRAVRASQDRPDVRASIDRLRDARARREASPALRAKLDETWAEFRKDIDRLKNRIAQRRKKIDEEYGEQLRKLGVNYDKERRLLERELDERRERILRTHTEEA